jgi:uncharacterized YigZ family protein
MLYTVVDRVEWQAPTVKASKFRATCFPVSSEQHARDELIAIRRRWANASHHCWAWRLGSPRIDRCGDDGEPSRSAGSPILSQLVANSMIDTTVVVTRWFGGTKLGVGGLARAYRIACSGVLDASSMTACEPKQVWMVEYEHGDHHRVDRILNLHGARSISAEFHTKGRRVVELSMGCVEEVLQAVADATSGRAVCSTVDGS